MSVGVKNTAPSKTPEEPRPQLSLVLSMCPDQGKYKPFQLSSSRFLRLSSTMGHNRAEAGRVSSQGNPVCSAETQKGRVVRRDTSP